MGLILHVLHIQVVPSLAISYIGTAGLCLCRDCEYRALCSAARAVFPGLLPTADLFLSKINTLQFMINMPNCF